MYRIPLLISGFLLSLGLISTPALAGSADAGVTYAGDVAPILQSRCHGCHREGQIGPMPLTSYTEVRPWAKSIQRQVVSRKMPPWFAAPESRPMKGDLNLSEDEIQTLVSWVTQGAPEGDRSALPPSPTYATFPGGWRHREPDLVLQPAEPFRVGKEMDDEYHCFHVDLGLDHDVWLKGAEFQAGNSAVVHHFILFGDTSGKVAELDAATPEPGWECSSMESLAGVKVLQMWAPGNVQPLTPEGVGRRLAAGSQLILQVHYHNTTGEDTEDLSRFALHLAQPEETIQKEMRGQLVSAWTLDIEAGDDHAEHQAAYTTPEDITVYSTGVHMHYRGKDMGLWATPPGGERQTLIWVPNYDFNWQLTYEFVEPFKAPRGTEFQMISHHDNSESNPHNPVIPPIDVKWGLATSDEMAFAGISFTVDGEELNVTPRLPEVRGGARAATGGQE